MGRKISRLIAQLGASSQTSKSTPHAIINPTLDPTRFQVHFFTSLTPRPIIHPSAILVGVVKAPSLILQVRVLLIHSGPRQVLLTHN